MSLTLDAIREIVKPHNDRIVAEHRLECALREIVRLRKFLRGLADSTFDAPTRDKILEELKRLEVP